MVLRISRPLLAIAALLALALAAAPAAAQLRPTPPDVPLWRTQANGDAVQDGLGFILPARIGALERKGFSSTRPDGGSVMTWYESADGAVSLRILLQLRMDIRGIPLPGADPLDRNWRMLQTMARMDYDGRFEPVSEERFAWGGQRPNAIVQWLRYPLASGPVLRATWYRNIGLWAVAVTAAAPEARRAEIDAAGRAALALPWPGAPLTADLRAMAPEWLSTIQACPDYPRQGAGTAIQAGGIAASMIGMGLSANFITPADILPHPVTQPANYCRIESFRAGERALIALGWRGDTSGYPAARYAFMADDGSTFLQVESLFDFAEAPEAERRGIVRPVWLTIANDRSLAAIRLFTDWPSYEQAKEAAIATTRAEPVPIVMLRHPAGELRIAVGPGAAPPPQPAAQPRTD